MRIAEMRISMRIVEFSSELSDKINEFVYTTVNKNSEATEGYLVREREELKDINENYIKTGGNVWVAVDSLGIVVGVIGLQVASWGGIIKNFYVDSTLGMGGNDLKKRLLEKAEKHAFEHGLNKISVIVRRGDEEKGHFYIEEKFNRVGLVVYGSKYSKEL